MVQQRYVLTAALFVTLGVTFALRISFSLLLTQMVYIPNANTDSLNTVGFSSEEICPIEYPVGPQNGSNWIGDNYGNRFQWSQQLQGLILSSFYWGYISFQIVSGMIVQKYSSKIVLIVSTFLSTIVLALTPLAVTYGEAYGLIVTRILIGLLQAPLEPCTTALGMAWFPIEERGRLNAIMLSGISTGSFLASNLIGLVISQTGRWDVVFYGASVIGAIWCIILPFLCYDSPHKHPFISDNEIILLNKSTEQHLEVERGNVPPTPWKAILKSKPVITLIVCSGLYSWAFSVINTDFSKYINDVVHVPIERNAIYSSVLRIANAFVSISTGFIGDWMHKKRGINLTIIRKTFAALSSIIPSIFAICATYSGCDEALVVTLLTISIAGQGLNSAGTLLNIFDLAPNYIGPITGIVSCVSSLASLLAPTVAGFLTPNAYLSEWRLVFWLTCGLHISKTIIFLIWGSAEVQPWNSPPKNQISL